MDSIRPIERARAYEAIVSRIRQLIDAGELSPGKQLPSERELAEAFKVSRAVVREAIRNLETQNLVEVRHGSGTYVLDANARTLGQDLTLLLELEKASLVDLYNVRKALELLATRLAAANATDSQLADLEHCLEELEEIRLAGIGTLEEFTAFSVKDAEFHQRISEASGNKILSNLLSAILPLFIKGRSEILRSTARLGEFLNPDQIRLVHQEHVDIFRAISARDESAAEYFAYRHVQRSISAWQRDE